MSASYDEVAYPSVPLGQTQPDRMAVIAHLRGLEPADPQMARVLEIGCSDAGNLAALAAYAPDAAFVGIDLSAAAVARAQDAVAALPNLTVVQADLRDFDQGGFDYVIAHGVYSWIPRPQDLLECVARNLAPRGIAYISYDVKPGAHLRTMVAEMLLRESSGIADARNLLRVVEKAEAAGKYAEILRAVARRTSAKPDYVLLHDELAAEHHPVFFDEFAARASEVGLGYLGEAHLADFARPVAEVPTGEIAREQWWDYVSNRTFRQSLWTRDAAGPLDAQALTELWLAAPAQHLRTRGQQSRLRLLRDVEVSVDRATRDDLLRLGAAWPGCVQASDLKTAPAAWLQMLAARAIEVRYRPVPCVRPGAAPRVVDYMRGQAAADGLVTTARHEMLRLEDELSRTAVSLMDGQATRAQIAEKLRLGPDDRVRSDLDALIESLGQSGLFVANP